MTVDERCSIKTVLPVARSPDDIKCMRIVQHNVYVFCASKSQAFWRGQ